MGAVAEKWAKEITGGYWIALFSAIHHSVTSAVKVMISKPTGRMS